MTEDPQAPGSGGRSGTAFVIVSVLFVVLFLAVALVLSPRLQRQLGMVEGSVGFPTPAAVTTAALTLDGVEVGVATWDNDGVCAEITDATGTTFRTCAVPDPLRPIWAIDAPDEADPGYVIVASPPEVASIAGLTTDGESLNGLAQARELPSAWTVIPLRPGAVVSELVAQNTEGREVGDAECGPATGVNGGPARLGGGCIVPRQD